MYTEWIPEWIARNSSLGSWLLSSYIISYNVPTSLSLKHTISLSQAALTTQLTVPKEKIYSLH